MSTKAEREIKGAGQEARDEIAKIIRESRSTQDALESAREELRAIENELGKRTIPYGGGFVAGKRRLPQYFPGVPGVVLDTKRRIYKDFVEELEKELELRRPVYLLPREVNPYTWNIPELRQMCRSEGLSDYGDKHILIARLKKVRK